MIYQQRLATSADTKVLSSLYESFIKERVQREAGKSQPQSGMIKSDFDYWQYSELLTPNTELRYIKGFCLIYHPKSARK